MRNTESSLDIPVLRKPHNPVETLHATSLQCGHNRSIYTGFGISPI